MLRRVAGYAAPAGAAASGRLSSGEDAVSGEGTVVFAPVGGEQDARASTTIRRFCGVVPLPERLDNRSAVQCRHRCPCARLHHCAKILGPLLHGLLPVPGNAG
jgi:hypothetical protein